MPTANAHAFEGHRPADANARATRPMSFTSHPSEADAWISVMTAMSRVSLLRIVYVTAIKRTLDMVAASMLLLVLSPLLICALVLIRLDSPGPAIFRQDRVGLGGRRFRLYKFRTMRHDPVTEVVWLIGEDGKARHKVRNDPRITRIGQWLRRTSIDELPQLLNIIKGDMSLIGPRPELPEIVEGYEPWQHQRHLVRPGLTGWWQVSGRSDLPMHENTELDIFYVHRQSFRLDWQIAWKTVRVVFRGLGAF